MESALRLTLIAAVLGLALGVAKFLHENRVEDEIGRLSGEVQRLREANDRLDGENERFRTLVRGLRDDSRVLDRRARETLGMARADELIILFPEDERTRATP